MFDQYRSEQFKRYNIARKYFIENHDQLIELEHFGSSIIFRLLSENIDEIERDYNEASYLYPFWQQYPPDHRGRKPRGDQYPWLEVGEHAIGDKLPRLLAQQFDIRDSGIPTGPDKRILLKCKQIENITHNFTDSIWLFMDIKSVGPRDDFKHTVMSHNQISGDGKWEIINKGMKNSILIASGKYRKHEFHCSIAPIYVLSDMTVAPVINITIKPVYSMLSLYATATDEGQPLRRITIASIPNGLLLLQSPGYLKTYPSLLFPGKDDKEKNPLKLRARVDFEILKQIDPWRIQELNVEKP